MRMNRAVLLLLPMLVSCSASQSPDQVAGNAPVQLADGPSLSAPRATHASVRIPNGNILIIGGCVADGCEQGAASASADMIAADGRRRLRTFDLRERRISPDAVALTDGRVLIVGGWVNGRASQTTEILNPATGESQVGPAMAGPRSGAVVVRLNDGRVLIAGGHDGQRNRADAEIFDPQTGVLKSIASLGQARSGATATLMPDGNVLIVGGGNPMESDRHTLASAELFNAATNDFAPTASLAQRRYKHGAALLPSGDVLIIGGSDERDYGGKLRSVERYDAQQRKFVAAGQLAVPRFKLAGGLINLDDGRILVAAGDDRPEIFDPGKGMGQLLDIHLGGQWNYLTATAIGNNAAYLAGGYEEGRIVLTNRSWLLKI